jgi:hypothetical protein
MYYKIQPEQIELHAFSSPSGDLGFQVGTNYVYANLSRSLTGIFGISGGIVINGVSLAMPSATNSVQGTDSFSFGGINNDISGVRNVSVNAESTTIYGTGNVAVNSYLANFPASSLNNTIIGGNGVNIVANTTGAMVLKDKTNNALSSKGNHTLAMSFVSGIFIENGGLRINNGNLIVTSSNSGILSGGLQVFGSATKNGVELATTGDLGTTSGALNTKIINTGAYAVSASGALNTTIINTGALINTSSGTLNTKIINTGAYAVSASGALDTRLINTGASLNSGIVALSGSSVFKTGNQTISGTKTFVDSPVANQSIYLQGNSGILSGVSGASSLVPTGSGHSIGSRGLISYSGQFLYLKISDAPHLWVRHSGDIVWP